MPTQLRSIFAALALVAAGALVAPLFGAPSTAGAQSKPDTRPASLQVINATKTNDTLAFVYDEEGKRLLLYTVVTNELKLTSVRNITWDAKIHEFKGDEKKSVSVFDVRKAVEQEEAKEREKKAEEDAKKAAEEAKKAAAEKKKNG